MATQVERTQGLLDLCTFSFYSYTFSASDRVAPLYDCLVWDVVWQQDASTLLHSLLTVNSFLSHFTGRSRSLQTTVLLSHFFYFLCACEPPGNFFIASLCHKVYHASIEHKAVLKFHVALGICPTPVYEREQHRVEGVPGSSYEGIYENDTAYGHQRHSGG